MRRSLLLALPAFAAALVLSYACSARATHTTVASPRRSAPSALMTLTADTTPTPYCHDGACHPRNADGYVTDGTPQAGDQWCSTPPGTSGPEPGQDECLAARHGGFVVDGDPQLDDAHCVGSAYEQAACVTARRHLPFSCVATIVSHEDPGWDPTRWNAGGSGAYGLFQALPGRKMAVAGADWPTSGATQTRWLLDHYVGAYGGVCAAAAHDIRYGTY